MQTPPGDHESALSGSDKGISSAKVSQDNCEKVKEQISGSLTLGASAEGNKGEEVSPLVANPGCESGAEPGAKSESIVPEENDVEIPCHKAKLERDSHQVLACGCDMCQDAARKENLPNKIYFINVDDLLRHFEKRLRMGNDENRTRSTSAASRSSVGDASAVCIPKIKCVDWYHFKNRMYKHTDVYAIEVLVDSAKYCNDFKTYQAELARQRKAGNAPVFESLKDPKEIRDFAGSRGFPERIRINSACILAILAELDDQEVSEHKGLSSLVHLYPFKQFLRLESSINDRLHVLESKWGMTKMEESSQKDDPIEDVTEESRNSETVESGQRGRKPGRSNPTNEAIQGSQENEGVNTHEYQMPSGLRKQATVADDDDSKENGDGRTISDARSVEEAGHEPVPEDHSARKADSRQPDSDVTLSNSHLTDSIKALQDLRCLRKFMDEYLCPIIKRINDPASRRVSFAELWYLFPRGAKVVSTSNIKSKLASTTSRGKGPSNAYQTMYQVSDTSGGRWNLYNGHDHSQPRWRVGSSENSAPSEDWKYQNDTRVSSANSFRISCYYIDWNGESFWPVSHVFVIQPFEGERDITSLEIYPLRYLDDPEKFSRKLIQQGERFCTLTKPSHQKYRGYNYICHPCGCPFVSSKLLSPYESNRESESPFSITGEVIVDFQEAFREDGKWQPDGGLIPLGVITDEVCEKWPIALWEDEEHTREVGTSTDAVYQDTVEDEKAYQDFLNGDEFLSKWQFSTQKGERANLQTLQEELRLLLPNRILGYVLRERKFFALNIDCLLNVQPDPEAFDGLELPIGHKKMVQALVKEHFNAKARNLDNLESAPDYDIIEGKGRGLIILLHGAPGVGKTSTAECVAAATGRPLFPITCGDLGLRPMEVEANLKGKFHLATLWKCVLLLDEADVFLAQRDKSNLERNAMVSVFLRILEYYDGILFLTTNRIGAFDDAFKSRIHVPLYYPELGRLQTIEIWRRNLQRLQKIEDDRVRRTGALRMVIEKDAILAYAEQHFDYHARINSGRWNGRQIRNAFQTAAALALYDASGPNDVPKLTIDCFAKVAQASVEFDNYINATLGRSEELRAMGRAERFPEAVPVTPSPDTRSGFKPEYSTPTKFYGHSGERSQLYQGQSYPAAPQPQQSSYGWQQTQYSNYDRTPQRPSGDFHNPSHSYGWNGPAQSEQRQPQWTGGGGNPPVPAQQDFIHVDMWQSRPGAVEPASYTGAESQRPSMQMPQEGPQLGYGSDLTGQPGRNTGPVPRPP